MYKGQPSQIQQHISSNNTKAINIASKINSQNNNRLSALYTP